MLALALIAAPPCPAAGAADPAGGARHPGAALIHGTVTLRDGATHTGYVRWVDEDAFWDDLFTARQHDLPWFAYADQQELAGERQRQYFASHGLVDRLMWAMHHRDGEVTVTRPFICRYGDLVALRPGGDGDEPLTAVLKDGREIALGGRSRDVGSDLVVYPPTGQAVTLEWDDLREIRFSAAPGSAAPYATRLTGSVAFRGGSLSGTIQWDTSECTSLDTLDGDEQDVPLGEVRRLERSRRGGSDLTLADGRTVNLTGTNDVDSGNRGASVEVSGLGRVLVPWDRFTSADLGLADADAPAYADFTVPAPLSGTVATTDGRALSGRLVYDLDEAFTNDLLHGDLDECTYQIPFARIASIAPTAPGACEVTLRDGRRLNLSGDEDTGEGHAGMLVFAEGRDTPTYILWSSVRLISFAP